MEELKGKKIELVKDDRIPSRLWGEFAEIEEEIIINNQRYYKIKLDNIQEGFGDSFTCPYGSFRFR